MCVCLSGKLLLLRNLKKEKCVSREGVEETKKKEVSAGKLQEEGAGKVSRKESRSEDAIDETMTCC